jgi:hypothetical protein
MATRNACSRLQCYDLWYEATKNNPPTPTPALSTDQCPPPAPSARRVQQLSDQSTASTIQDQVHSALNEALGPQGLQILAEIQSLNSTIDTEETTHTENSDNHSNHNVNVYSSCQISPSNNCITSKLSNLKSKLQNYYHKKLHSVVKRPSTIITNPHQKQPSSTQSSTPAIHTTSSPVHSKLKHLAVIDSGATDTMTSNKSLFESITYYSSSQSSSSKVMLGNEQTFHPVRGYGWINYYMGGYRIRQLALYVPALGNTTLLLVKQHMRWQGTYFHAEDNEAILAYPTCQIYFHIQPEISLPIHPAVTSTAPFAFNEETAVPAESSHHPTKSTIQLVSKQVKTYVRNPVDQSQFKGTVHLMLLSPNATIPTKQATPGSIGYGVTSTQHVIIRPGDISKLSTGLSTALPPSMYICIAPRSSNALNHLTVEGGGGGGL